MKAVKEEIDNLFNNFENSKLFSDYLNIKKQINNNEEIIALIEEIKRLQKIVVNNNDLIVDKKLNALNKKLDSYPIYQDYLEIIDKINEELHLIENEFNKYFYEILKI